MKTNRTAWGIVIVAAMIVLALVGHRISPPGSTPTAGKSDRTCNVDAPEALKAAAQHWCASDLVSRVAVTVEEKSVITVVQFSPNGGQTFQLQGASILENFRTLTEEMAAASPGRDVAVQIQGAAERRVAGCARLRTGGAATCKVEP